MLPPITPEITIVLGIIGFAIFLFITEFFRVDTSAVLVLLLLGIVSQIPGYKPIISMPELFSGFSSNAVIAIIGVMIIGAGLDNAGLIRRVANLIYRLFHGNQTTMLIGTSGVAGIMSGIMQNVGAAALFVPVVGRLSQKSGISISRMLMPMGFCTILGGTLTMVGSSPLILLNDLLPDSVEKFGLFDVLPLGLCLLATGILYFSIYGYRLLPTAQTIDSSGLAAPDYIRELYGVEDSLVMARLEDREQWLNRTVGDLEHEYGINIVGMEHAQNVIISPHRDIEIPADTTLAIMAAAADTHAFLKLEGIREVKDDRVKLAEALLPDQSGIAEIIVRPDGDIVGKKISQIRIRKTYGLTPLAIYRGNQVFRDKLREMILQSGDYILCLILWKDLSKLENDANFVVVTANYPEDQEDNKKLWVALAILITTLLCVSLTDLRISYLLLAGAMAMVIAGILTMDEAYQAISWKTVFLLAGLLPLGIVVETSGTGSWIASFILILMDGYSSNLLLYILLALLATGFSLIISNVGATVILVPMAIQIAYNTGADVRICALITGVCASNSFILPTHQVNALIMGPGNYAVRDFLRAGSIMSVLFIVITIVGIELFY